MAAAPAIWSAVHSGIAQPSGTMRSTPVTTRRVGACTGCQPTPLALMPLATRRRWTTARTGTSSGVRGPPLLLLPRAALSCCVLKPLMASRAAMRLAASTTRGRGAGAAEAACASGSSSSTAGSSSSPPASSGLSPAPSCMPSAAPPCMSYVKAARQARCSTGGGCCFAGAAAAGKHSSRKSQHSRSNTLLRAPSRCSSSLSPSSHQSTSSQALASAFMARAVGVAPAGHHAGRMVR
mmetsp:Transcript_4113/g.12010  ORF Transcript_4113/g.12010 Transcript_4113/m.12010 type:complete len:237 (-) Transcript_4113:95-805(-)